MMCVARKLWCVFIAVLGQFSASVEVPVAMYCEFRWETECCLPALAALEMAINDANNKDGTLVPELGNTTKDIQLKLDYYFDPDDVPAWEAFKQKFRSPNAPVAIFGGYYTTRVTRFAHTIKTLRLPQFAYASGPIFRSSPVYDWVFRTLPADSLLGITAHKVMAHMGIKDCAVFYSDGDGWSTGLLTVIQSECASSSHTCNVRPEPVAYGMSSAALGLMLSSVATLGIRCMINVLVYTSDGYNLGEQAYLQQLAGAKASGFVWMYALNHFSGPKPYHFYGGLRLTWPNQYMKESRTQAYKDRWASVVTNMVLPDVPPYNLPLSEGSDASSCMFLTGPVYSSVARMRIAMENVNMSMPTSPLSGGGATSVDWIGTSLKNALQNGVTLDDIVDVPNLRQSPALGQQWEESSLNAVVENLLDTGETIQLFTGTYTTLSDGPDLSRGMLSGTNVPFGTTANTPPGAHSAPPGHLLTTPCNGPNIGKCFSGVCDVSERLGNAPGWCRCPPNFGGGFCNIRGVNYANADPDVGTVDVNMSFVIAKFGGLEQSGDAFTLDAVITLSWHDKRVPYDTKYYSESETEKLLADLWYPKIAALADTFQLESRTMTITRAAGESKTSNPVPPVKVSLKEHFHVKNALDPEFGDFPFDTHTLSTAYHTTDPAVRIRHVFSDNLVPQSTLDIWEQTGWTAYGEGEEFASLTPVRAGFEYRLKVKVQRAFTIHIFRLLLPSILLVCISWSSFWISPGALMPRFAAGFISFLTMQSFKQYASSLMPNGGKIPNTAWIDVYISISSILMTLSVGETVVVQYINENISNRACKNVDITARWAFPASFIIFLVIMFLPGTHSEFLNIFTHTYAALFGVVFFSYAMIQAFYFPMLIVMRGLQNSKPTKGTLASNLHREWTFEPKESQCIYDRICKVSAHVEEPGYANTGCFVKWLVRWNKALKPIEDDISGLAHDYFDDHFHYPVFKVKFGAFLTDVERMLTGVPLHKHDPKDASKKSAKAASSESLVVSQSSTTLSRAQSGATSNGKKGTITRLVGVGPNVRQAFPCEV